MVKREAPTGYLAAGRVSALPTVVVRDLGRRLAWFRKKRARCVMGVDCGEDAGPILSPDR